MSNSIAKLSPQCVFYVCKMASLLDDNLLTHWGRIKMAIVFADDIFKCIFLTEIFCIAIQISLKFIPKGPIDNMPALVEIIVWRPLGDELLSAPVMA